jgi:hypothetical protein
MELLICFYYTSKLKCSICSNLLACVKDILEENDGEFLEFSGKQSLMGVLEGNKPVSMSKAA